MAPNHNVGSALPPCSGTTSSTTVQVQLARSQSQASSKSYMHRRRLSRHVTTPQLWAFCVGVVICGSATGWQAGLPFGWINLFTATLLAIVVYAVSLWSAVEMCTALPFSSAHTAFAQAAFGSRVGAINGFIVMISFAQQAATNVDLLSYYVIRLCGWPKFAIYGLWILCYLAMIYINLNSARFFKTVFAINTYCVIGICVYIIWALVRIPEIGDWSWISTVGDDEGGAGAGRFTSPLSLMKVVDCFCFAIWWFVGIEQMVLKAFPVTIEEVKDVKGGTMPAVNWGMGTLFFYSLTLIWIVPVLPPYSPGAAATDHPIGVSILQGLLAIDPSKDKSAFESGQSIIFLVLLLLTQFITPVANLYATSRYMYGLSRGGLLPTSLSLTAEPLGKAARAMVKNWFARSASSLSSLSDLAKVTAGLPSDCGAQPLNAAAKERPGYKQAPPRARAASLSIGAPPCEKPRPMVGSVQTLELAIAGASRKLSVSDQPQPAPSTSLPTISGNSHTAVSFESSSGSVASQIPTASNTQSASGSSPNRPKPPIANRTPVRAVLTSAILAYVFNWILELVGLLAAQAGTTSPSAPAQSFSEATELLLRISTWFANLSHAIQLASYLKLRYSMKSLNRPCPSPVGAPGAVLALVIVVIVGILAPFGLTNRKPYVWSVVLLAVSCTVFLVYFQRVAKPRLVANAPERLFIRSILEQQFAASSGNNNETQDVDGSGATAAHGPMAGPLGRRPSTAVGSPLPGSPTKNLSIIDQSFSSLEHSSSTATKSVGASGK